MRFLAAGFCVPVVPESGILVGMYEIHEEVLCPEGIYPHGDTGYPVCNSCKEYAGGHPARLGSNTSPERICRFYQQSGVLNRQQ